MAELIEEVVERIDSLEDVRVCPCCGDGNQVSITSQRFTDVGSQRSIRRIGMALQMFCGNCGAEFEVTADYEAMESGFRLLRGRE